MGRAKDALIEEQEAELDAGNSAILSDEDSIFKLYAVSIDQVKWS
jgi:hypothetical protein